MADEPLPGDYPLTLYVGDARTWTFGFTEDDGSTPVDMSGRTWRAQIRASRAQAAALLSTITVDTTDAATGVLTAKLTATEARNLAGNSSAFWDLEATLASDTEDVRTYLTGDVEIEGDVSHS